MRRSSVTHSASIVLTVAALIVGLVPTAAVAGPRGLGARVPADRGVAREALKDAVVAWGSHAPSPRLEGEPAWFNATFDSTEVPAFGVLQIRDATTDTVIASTPITSTHAFLDSGLVLLALGTHDIRAEFVGDPAFVRASDQVTIDVIPDTVVSGEALPLNLTTFYPLAEGYRNRLRIWGQCQEYSGCTPKVEVFTDTNRIVRRWIFPTITQGIYKVIWDGRTAAGTMLRAGKYRIHHVVTDWAGNVLTVDQWVTLSHRTVRWVTVTVTWSGASYVYADTGGSGWISKSASPYTGGVRLGIRASAHGGWADITFRHRLHTGLAYRSMYVRAYGRSLNASNDGMAWCSPQSQAVTIGTTLRWYSTPVNSGCWPQGVAHPKITLSSLYARRLDIVKLRFMYAYAVWAI